jgi:hypothetical protein
LGGRPHLFEGRVLLEEHVCSDFDDLIIHHVLIILEAVPYAVMKRELRKVAVDGVDHVDRSEIFAEPKIEARDLEIVVREVAEHLHGHVAAASIIVHAAPRIDVVTQR